MKLTHTAGRTAAYVAITAMGLLAAGCSSGSLGSSSGGASGGSGAATTITWLVANDEPTVKSSTAMIAAFTAANPTITVKLDTRPGGSDGDNLVKTKLSTGDMAEVFGYNNGSLLSAIKPATNLTPLDDQPWASTLDKTFAQSTKVDGKLYGGPIGTAFGGGVLYNRPLYAKLGLKVPTTWAEFMKNNDAIKAAGVAPVEQTYGLTWTSQLFLLGDYHNVEATVPTFAADYTAGKVKYATTPAALKGFQNIQALADGGYFNKDFASAKLNDGLLAVATGTAAHYPQLGATAAGIDTVAPGKANDVGFFALPGADAAKNGMTVWPGFALYIPKSVQGDKLDAAKKLVAFAATQSGCDAYSKDSPPQGPYLTTACKLPSTVSQVAKDTGAYFDSSKATPALEFESPIKGPSLEQICIQVGTKQVPADKGAALYDEDVKKQAQQLGLPGWS